MIRFLYVCLLRLHPRLFRQRFGEEMLWIFDQMAATRRKWPLLADALLSLVRQRALRSGTREEPVTLKLAQAASDCVPLFYTFENFKPRTGALINGAILSVAVFGAVCFAFSYGLTEPLRPYLAGAQPGSSFSTLSPGDNANNANAASGAPSGPSPQAGADSDKVWARLRSLFSASKSPHRTGPNRARAAQGGQPGYAAPSQEADGAAKPPKTQAAANPVPAPLPTGRTSRNVPGARPDGANGVPYQPVEIPEQILQSYIGTYFADSPHDLRVSITVAQGQLNAEVAGQAKSVLLPISQTRFFFAGASDRWVEFSKSSDGTVDGLDIFQGDSHIAAHRILN